MRFFRPDQTAGFDFSPLSLTRRPGGDRPAVDVQSVRDAGIGVNDAALKDVFRWIQTIIRCRE